ncbi:unnamed protein product [Rhodiola kirilowii]
MVEEAHQSSLAAPVIFFIVTAFQFASKYLDDIKKKGGKSEEEMKLRGEIKQLLKEASTLSQPSTFAQAAKLRRMAAAKEKELVKYQESLSKEKNSVIDSYLKILLIVKVITYFFLICWFWKLHVAVISRQLVQPFGKLLSWRGGGYLNDNVLVGIVPWLVLSTRVSKLMIRLFT